MARRRLLSDDTWAKHLEPPTDERETARHYTLGPDDLAQVIDKRGDANRLGFALVSLYLRHPGRVLEAGELPPGPGVAHIARQLDVAPAAFDDYALRDATRRSHVAEAMRAGGYVPFDRAAAHGRSRSSPRPPRRSSDPASSPASWWTCSAAGGWRSRRRSYSRR